MLDEESLAHIDSVVHSLHLYLVSLYFIVRRHQLCVGVRHAAGLELARHGDGEGGRLAMVKVGEARPERMTSGVLRDRKNQSRKNLLQPRTCHKVQDFTRYATV